MAKPLEIVELSLAEILSSLSYALDLTGGHPAGHAQRTCLIGMRLAQAIGLEGDDLSSLYHALLMKDAGCSSNAARMFEIFGSDDIAAKRLSKLHDWSNLFDAARYAAAVTLPQGALLTRARRLLHISTHQSETSGMMMQARCDRGAQIALSLGLGETAATCVRHLDEHWDGRGAPGKLAGEHISLLGRIACLAQTMDVFTQTFDVPTAYEIARKRAGKWFDPALVDAARSFENDAAFWQSVAEDPRATLLQLDVHAAIERASEARIDAVCDAFAQIVDAKSHFTAEHSSRVTHYAVEIAQGLGIGGRRLTILRRAALLHDIGKLAVSNAILDKPGQLTDDEFAQIKTHPFQTQRILSGIRGFANLTEIACAHHERLDGHGYWRGLTAEQLTLDMRILAVADVFDALSADRPYRSAMPVAQVFGILDKDAGVALDRDCIGILRDIYFFESPFAVRPAETEIRWAA